MPPPKQLERPPAEPSDWKPDSPPRDWNYIVIHHTASDSGSVESIDAAHRKRKDSRGNPWLGIGYHFLIGNGNGMPDGAVEATFRWKKQLHGAHAGSRQYNEHGIGVSLVGNFDEHPPTAKQWESLVRLVRYLRRTYGIDELDVIGHSDIKATRCPGRLFSLERLRSESTPREQTTQRNLPRFRSSPYSASPGMGLPRY